MTNDCHGLLRTEDPQSDVPEVYKSLNFRSVQDMYSSVQDTAMSRYSTLRADNIDNMLSGGLEKFYKKYHHLSRKINLRLPTPEVHFENLSFTVEVPETNGKSAASSVGTHLQKFFTPWRQPKKVKKQVLHPMSGVIKPGSLTLILANPGAGKSTFLKALAGKLKNNSKAQVGGNILYQGFRGNEIDLIKLVGLVDQRDNHIPTLTVRETFKFADMCMNGDPNDQPEEMQEVAALRTELFLHILGLTNCSDTVVGDALLRGVSGGERKRVTVGEMLVGGQSLFLCDEISTGLDTSATFDIITSLRTWCKTLGGSAVVALLQPTPEVVELFDDIMMINEGHLMYHGPRVEILNYFKNLGFTCPPRVDPADFLIEVTSGRGKKYGNESVETTSLPNTSEEFSNIFFQSDLYRKTHEIISRGFSDNNQLQNAEDFNKMKSVANLARSKENSEYGLAFIPSTLLLLQRQKMIWLRDKPMLWGKLIEALVVGLVLGMIFYNTTANFFLRMCFFIVAVFQRQAWQQISIAFQLRQVFYKQRSRNFFRTSSYAIAESIVQVPINLVVAMIMVTLFYFLSGLTKTFVRYIITLLVCFCFQHAICAYMTMLSAFTPSITSGQALAAMSVAFFLLFSGNIILSNLIPDYWIWVYWFNPVAWALRSIMISEFNDSRYDAVTREANLKSFAISQGTEYIWFGIGMLILYYFLFTSLNAIGLHYLRFESFTGVSAKTPGKDQEEDEAVYVEVKTPKGSSTVNQVPASGAGLPFTPANLCIRDLEYYVTLPTGEEKQLLQGITAHFEPGTMTALMGASGAGKTTLMDVIAGRKTGGRITGDIIVNGEPKNPANFSRITAYCEQMDIHSEGATIREALEFSANLRLPHTFTKQERMNLVNETMELVELTSIGHERVSSLSVEQKKRVTIGVEVVSNPSILFLDEPTSGLDARAAMIVMRGVQSIARTGRTVVCTIHQPSINIFELFDRLLLLQRGGFTAYFGELGKDSVKMLEYFASIPGTEKIRPQYNPATYMLEVIGAGIGRDVKDYSIEYANSELYKQNRERTIALCDPPLEFVRFSTMNFEPIATSFINQLKELMTKQRRTYWRTPSYNSMRLFMFPLFAIIFGTTFLNLSTSTTQKINSHIGLIYNSMDFIGVVSMMTVIEISCAERAVFYRERMSNYYGPLPYTISLFLAEVPYLAVVVILFVVIEYFLVGWNSGAGHFFFFLFNFFLYASICTFIGQWMSALMPNAKVATVAVGAMSAIFNLFSGYLKTRPFMHGYYKWFQYLIPSSYSLSALCGDQIAKRQNIINITLPNGTSYNSTVEAYIAKQYDFRPDSKYLFMLGLIIFWVVLQVLIYLTLKYVSHLKR